LIKPVTSFSFDEAILILYEAFLRLFLILFKFASSNFLNLRALEAFEASTVKILISNPATKIIIINKAIFVNADNSKSPSTSLVSVDTSCFGVCGATYVPAAFYSSILAYSVGSTYTPPAIKVPPPADEEELVDSATVAVYAASLSITLLQE